MSLIAEKPGRNGRTPGLRPQGKVLPAHQRANNRSLVLQRLFHDGPMSRAELARSTRLTRVTITDLISELAAEGLVEDQGIQRGGVGKPATIVAMRTHAHAIVAIDLSLDTQMRGAVLDLRGEQSVNRSMDVTGDSGAAFIDVLERFAAGLVAASKVPVIGVGIGAPGIIDPDGRVIQAPNRNWYDLPLADMLSQRLNLPVYVGNDADVAALGEYSYGSAADSMMVVTIRQGVGAGLVYQGVRAHGSHAAAGEIGHLTVDPQGATCACGRRGCLETIVAEPALRAAINGQTDDVAQQKLGEIGKTLGAALAPIVAALNLAEVLLSGPVDLLDGAFREAVLATIVERTMPATAAGFDLRMATLGPGIVLSGAAGLVLDAQLGVS